MYFCGRILCGNVPFTSLNGRNITFVLLRIVECTSKTKTILLGIFCAKIVRTERPPVKSSADFCEHAHFFWGGGVGCAPWPELEWTENSQRNVPSKKAINYFIDQEVEELYKYILTSKRKGLRGKKKCKWHKRFVLSAVAVSDSEICKKSIALNQSYSVHTSR